MRPSLLILATALLLPACGKPIVTSLGRTDAVMQNQAAQESTESLTKQDVYSDQEFLAACQGKDGRLSSDGQYCLTHTDVSLPNDQADPLVIAKAALAGQLLQTEATNGNGVVVTLDGRPLDHVPARTRILKNGRLEFFVNNPSNYADVSALLWTCYDRHKVNNDLGFVACEDSLLK